MARQRKKGELISGWVVLDKTAGPTSTQSVGKVRHLFNAQKAGHAGTLDPLATGILPIALGEATKTVPFLMQARKVYQFTLCWGEETNTLDREGEVIARSDKRPSEAQILRALPEFAGLIEQVPPIFSAIKVEGERAYDLARDGEKPILNPRQVELHSVELLEKIDHDHACFELVCGKGFYIRAFARDLAAKLGTCAYVSELRRRAVGPFCEGNALSLDALTSFAVKGEQRAYLQPLQAALDGIPAAQIGRSDVSDIRLGRGIKLLPRHISALRSHFETQSEGQQLANPDRLVLAEFEGVAVALGRLRAGRFLPSKVFNPDTAE